MIYIIVSIKKAYINQLKENISLNMEFIIRKKKFIEKLIRNLKYIEVILNHNL